MITIHTFDEICESNKFNHDEEFVTKETYDRVVMKYINAVVALRRQRNKNITEFDEIEVYDKEIEEILK